MKLQVILKLQLEKENKLVIMMKKLFLVFAIFFMLKMGCASSTNISPTQMRYEVSAWSDEELKRAYWEWLGALRQAERNATTLSSSPSNGGSLADSLIDLIGSSSRSNNINNINQIDSGLMVIRSEMSVRGIYP